MAQTASQVPRPIEEGGRSPQKHALPLRGVILVLLLLGGLGAALWYLGTRPTADGLALSGRLEGYETDIGAKVAGRIQAISVREGDAVAQGDLLVTLDDDELQARLQGAIATLESARQREASARLQIAVLESQIQEAQLSLRQSEGDATGRVAQAEATVAAAIAQLREAEAQAVRANADWRLAQTNRDRYAQLLREGATSQQQYDQTQTTLETAEATLRSQQAAVDAARRQVTAAQGGLTQTQTTTLNPDIRSVQLDRLNTQLQQAQLQWAIAQSEVATAQAARDQTQAQLNDLTLHSPTSGVVTTRSAEPGMVVTTGRTLLSIVDLNTVYFRGFIPAGEVGRVRVGQAARVYLDSNPDQPLTGYLAAIDAQASFTPENIYFKEDRVQQVFGVRIHLDNPQGYAKPGMPADAEIVLDDV